MPSTTETSADDDDEEDAGLWLFSQAGQKEPDEDVQVERLTERHVQDVQLQMGRFWDNDYEAADRVCRERSQHNLVYALAHSFWGVTRACFTLEASQIEEAAARIARLERLASACAPAALAHKRDAITVVSQWLWQTGDPLMSLRELHATVVLGEALMLSGILHFLRESMASMVRGALLLRWAWKTLEKCSTERQRQIAQGAYVGEDWLRNEVDGTLALGVGIIHLAGSMLPESVLKLIQFVGFPTDRQLAKQEIAACANSSSTHRQIGVLMIATLHSMWPSFCSSPAEQHLADAKRACALGESIHPRSPVFACLSGRIARMGGSLDEAISTLKLAAVPCAGGMGEVRVFAAVELGWAHMQSMAWEEAARQWESVAREHEWFELFFTYLAIANQLMAHTLNGDDPPQHLLERLASLQHKCKVRKVSGRTMSVDQFVSRKVATYVVAADGAAPAAGSSSTAPPAGARRYSCGLVLPALEVLYLFNALVSMRKAHAYKLLVLLQECEERAKVVAAQQQPPAPPPADAAPDDAAADEPPAAADASGGGEVRWAPFAADELALLCLLKGRVLTALGMAEEAEGCYMRVLALQESIRSESWLPPFANYELGVLLLRSRSTASEGLKKLHEVAAFTPDYDFKLKLVLKCHLTLIDYEDRTMGSAEA